MRDVQTGLTLTFRTAGWAIICATRAGALALEVEMKFRTPLGSPACTVHHGNLSSCDRISECFCVH